MSTTRGILQSFLNPTATRTDASGTVAPEAPASPFTAVGRQAAPAIVASDSADTREAALPDRFGFEAQTETLGAQPGSSLSPAPAVAAMSGSPLGESQSDSFSIRQLELRAIFGVDREMTPKEIFERCRALPGIKNIARVSSQDMGTIDALRNLLPNLGFGTAVLKLYADSVALEFIREGPVLLAVQTEGGFAPGVRETLMLVAREFGRLS